MDGAASTGHFYSEEDPCLCIIQIQLKFNKSIKIDAKDSNALFLFKMNGIQILISNRFYCTVLQ